MTSIISLKKVRCKNCHKCIRSCPVNSIMYKDDQAQIMPEQCVLCGHCLNTCPQNAKTVLSDIFKIRGYIKSHATTVVSIAPSFSGLLKKPDLTCAVLKQLGFTYVQETSQGAAYVSAEYSRLLELGTMDNMITTCCPTINMLLEKYYPDLLPMMAPVVSPMIAHAKLLREQYGPDAKIIFAGPCISKKEEARDPRHAGLIDAVLTFEELVSWVQESGIDLDSLTPVPFDNPSPKSARMYPVTSGIVTTMLAQKGFFSYKPLCVDDVENCKALFEDLRKGSIHGCFIEVNACPGGCINGPVSGHAAGRFSAQLAVEDYTGAEKDEFPDLPKSNDLAMHFADASTQENMPTEEQIRQILRRIGKESKEDELNCGACGYSTCREKAISIFQGKSEPTMCLPYMKELAQSLSNSILKVTPNVIFVVDEDLRIREFNEQAEKIFGITRKEALDTYLYELIDTTDYEHIIQNRSAYLDRIVTYDNLGITFSANILYMPEQRMVLGILKDITAEEQAKANHHQLQMDTIAMAQKVIDKQMTVAQEIAGLLGETTAETKVTLSRLKDMVAKEE